MGIPMRNTLFLLAAIWAGLAFSGPARAACTAIDHANYTIASPGEYCLTANVVATSNGITINADNVTLDCGGYTIDGSAQAASTTGRGVMAINRNGITIQNCTIKGFMEGIRLVGMDGTIRGNMLIAPLSRGIIVNGDGNVIDANRVTDAGGASNYSLGAYGIYTTGSAIIRGNTVSGVVPTLGSGKSGYGIYMSGNSAGVIQGNIVRNVLSDDGKIAMALTAYSSSGALLKENILVNPPNSYAYALYCSGAGNVSAGNIFQGFVSGIASSCANLPPQ
jgi:hypothetical protein